MPPIFAAAPQSIPSRTPANDRSPRLWLTALDRRASPRNSSAESSSRNLTADGMARILSRQRRQKIRPKRIPKLSFGLATPAGLEPATCRLEGGCSIQLSYGAEPISRAAPCSALVRPGNNTVRRKIVGIGQNLGRLGLRLLDAVGDAATLGIGNRLFLAVELELHLRAHVR
jgi:hypothetical protein